MIDNFLRPAGSAFQTVADALRLLGCDIKKHVDLHSLPPVTGFLTLGKGCSIEPEVELRGHWIDGDTFHLGRIEVGPNARVGTRSTLLPGARVGKRAEIAPGSGVFGRVPADQLWSGAPAEHIGTARGPWDEQAPPNKPIWLVAYGATGMAASLIPAVGSAAGLAVLWPWLRHADSVADIARIGAIGVIPATLVGFVVTALVILGAVRALGRGLVAGHHPIHGGQGWRAWTTMRILDEAQFTRLLEGGAAALGDGVGDDEGAAGDEVSELAVDDALEEAHAPVDPEPAATDDETTDGETAPADTTTKEPDDE